MLGSHVNLRIEMNKPLEKKNFDKNPSRFCTVKSVHGSRCKAFRRSPWREKKANIHPLEEKLKRKSLRQFDVEKKTMMAMKITRKVKDQTNKSAVTPKKNV